MDNSQKKLFNLIFHFLDAVVDWTIWLSQNCDGNNVSGNTASSSKISLFTNINVWDILIFAQKWQVKDDLKWLGIGSEDNKISNTSVQCFGGLVSSLFQKFESFGLIEEIKESLTHLVISFWPGSGFLDGIFFFL